MAQSAEVLVLSRAADAKAAEAIVAAFEAAGARARLLEPTVGDAPRSRRDASMAIANCRAAVWVAGAEADADASARWAISEVSWFRKELWIAPIDGANRDAVEAAATRIRRRAWPARGLFHTDMASPLVAEILEQTRVGEPEPARGEPATAPALDRPLAHEPAAVTPAPRPTRERAFSTSTEAQGNAHERLDQFRFVADAVRTALSEQTERADEHARFEETAPHEAPEKLGESLRVPAAEHVQDRRAQDEQFQDEQTQDTTEAEENRRAQTIEPAPVVHSEPENDRAGAAPEEHYVAPAEDVEVLPADAQIAPMASSNIGVEADDEGRLLLNAPVANDDVIDIEAAVMFDAADEDPFFEDAADEHLDERAATSGPVETAPLRAPELHVSYDAPSRVRVGAEFEISARFALSRRETDDASADGAVAASLTAELLDPRGRFTIRSETPRVRWLDRTDLDELGFANAAAAMEWRWTAVGVKAGDASMLLGSTSWLIAPDGEIAASRPSERRLDINIRARGGGRFARYAFYAASLAAAAAVGHFAIEIAGVAPQLIAAFT